MPRDLTEPWRAFLADLDALVTNDVHLHCCGGFVVTTRYGMPRTTADLDVLSILPRADQHTLAKAAGRGLGLIRLRGHLPKGGYDVPYVREPGPAPPPAVR